MKTLITSAVAAFSIVASAFTVDELNSIPVKSVTADNAAAVFDAAVASTNCSRIKALVTLDKVSLEDAVHKTMGKTPLLMCKAALDGSAVTNYTLIAEAARAIDVTVPMNKREYDAARAIISYRRFIVNNAEVAKPIIADIYAKNKLFGAQFYCSFCNPQLREIFAAEGPVAYEAVKPLIKENANTIQAAIFWNYAFYWAHDYDGFESIYDKKLIDPTFYWLYPTSRVNPTFVQFMKDQLEVYKATLTPTWNNRDEIFLRTSKPLDAALGNKEATHGVIDYLSTTKAKLNAALYCNDVDKVIEILIACDTTLEAKDIDAAIAAINALDPDYKPAEVLKALKAVNQRYTLKLYDDRDTWEPTLSKLRAMIEIR